jgi:hypothetical protein
MSEERSKVERANSRRYTLELGAASVIYAISVMGAGFTVRRLAEDSIWRIPLSLIPALAAIAMVLAVVRYVMRADEMQQRTFGIGAIIALVLTIALSFTWGFLENYAGLPPINIFLIGMFGVVGWAFAAMWAGRRYQ